MDNMSRSRRAGFGIKVPCVLPGRAWSDYNVFVRSFRENFPICWSKLPGEVKGAHDRWVENVKREYPKELTVSKRLTQAMGFLPTYVDVRTEEVRAWKACQEATPAENTKEARLRKELEAAEGALNFFRRVVVQYKDFAGYGCWSMLPDNLQNKHSAYATTVDGIIQQSKGKSGGFNCTCEPRALLMGGYMGQRPCIPWRLERLGHPFQRPQGRQTESKLLRLAVSGGRVPTKAASRITKDPKRIAGSYRATAAPFARENTPRCAPNIAPHWRPLVGHLFNPI